MVLKKFLTICAFEVVALSFTGCAGVSTTSTV